MELLATIALVVGFAILIWVFFNAGTRRVQTEEEERMTSILQQEAQDDYLEQTKAPRVKSTRTTLLDRLTFKISTSRTLKEDEGLTFMQELDRRLVLAGIRDRFSPERALAWALMIWGLGVVLPILLALLGMLPNLFFLIIVVFAALYPPLKLRSLITSRQDAIKAEVPFFIQQLYMAISTSMSTIDEAIMRVSRNSTEDPYDSILSNEFGQAHAEYRVGGRDMESALRGVSHRTGVMAVDNLVEALIQGLRTGAEMEVVLREYSEQAREIWRQDMREFKNKKEPLVTMGLVITMFGGFLFIATPLVISLMNTLSSI